MPMAVCEKAEKTYADAVLIICITSDDADIIKTEIPFRLILPLIEKYKEKNINAIELIGGVADTVSASEIIIKRDENEIAVAFYK
jgi:hypothetical protein